MSGIQVGSKVELAADGSIEEIYVAVRPVLPMQGCLDCAELIDPHARDRAANPDEEEDQPAQFSEKPAP